MPVLDDNQMRLRARETLWQALPRNQTLPVGVAPQSGRVRTTDVVIVGGGITGSFLAERLSREDRDVVVIDRHQPATGSTAASTAMLQWELDASLLELEDRLGFEAAARISAQCRRAVQDIGRLASDNSLACAYRPRASLYLAGNELDASDLREECRLREAMGIDAVYLDANGLERLGYYGEAGIRSSGSAALDPVALASGLMKLAQARGAVLLSPGTASEYEATASGVTVRLQEGETVRGRILLLATGYEMPEFVPTAGHQIISTWALAARQGAALLPEDAAMLVWEASDPYLYFRPASEGYLVAGGEDADIDNADARDALIGTKTEAILKKLAARCPSLEGLSADFAWSGFFGESDDSLPFIGPVPGYSNCFAAYGYGGNGITFSAMAAGMIAEAVSGRPHPNAALYALDRDRRHL
jgi:glycine/D-amino acid oxidase-like deaminating enzyme